MDSALPPLLQAASGAIGSAVGNAIVFPLDLATTRLQHTSSSKRTSLLHTLHDLLSRRGASGLYAGLEADTLSTLLSNFLYFFCYASLHKSALRYRHHSASAGPTLTASPAGIGAMTAKADHQSQPPALGVLAELVIGVLAGVASKGITLPISAVCVRQQLGSHDDESEGSHPLSFIDTLRAIHRESGFSGLFSALPPTIPLALLPSLTLYIHSVLLRLLLPARHRAHPPGSATFLLGALSNALATIPLYPLVLVKALSQSGADKGKSKRKVGMVGTLVRIVNREGVEGLYKGLEGQLVKGVVQQGVLMLIKQRVEEGVVRAYRARH